MTISRTPFFSQSAERTNRFFSIIAAILHSGDFAFWAAAILHSHFAFELGDFELALYRRDFELERFLECLKIARISSIQHIADEIQITDAEPRSKVMLNEAIDIDPSPSPILTALPKNTAKKNMAALSIINNFKKCISISFNPDNKENTGSSGQLHQFLFLFCYIRNYDPPR
jgi:hypothetical protein